MDTKEKKKDTKKEERKMRNFKIELANGYTETHEADDMSDALAIAMTVCTAQYSDILPTEWDNGDDGITAGIVYDGYEDDADVLATVTVV